ncbi:MAG: DUF2271 domain-containing protein [Acidimicrobiales bacterium]
MANQSHPPSETVLTAAAQSRYADVSRRAFMKGTALAGLAGLAGLTTLGGLACGPSDAEVLADGAKRTTGTPSTAPAASRAATNTAGTETSAATETSTATAGLPQGLEMVVDFTFTPTAGGRRILNPYVAVWVEDSDENLLHTLALHIQPGNGTRWLRELRRWHELNADPVGAAVTISAATRPAGAYSYVWDCHGPDGRVIADGTYYVCVEASREHGPYQLIREPVTISTRAFTQPLTDSGELTNAQVSLSV